jgi:hypothetical protein
MADWVPIYPINKTKNQSTPFTPFLLSSNLHTGPSLDLTTKDGALGLPVDLGQLFLMSLPWRGPSRSRASMVSLLVRLKTSRFFITQVRWLSSSGLLVNLSILHRERVRSSLCSLVRSGPGVQCPFWCVIQTTSDVNNNQLHLREHATMMSLVRQSSCSLG